MSLVADSSAILAAFLSEEGGAEVLPLLRQAMMSCVNIAEVLTTAQQKGGISIDATGAFLRRLEIVPYPFDEEQARVVAYLRGATRHRGLGIGDRSCLALARILGVPILTGDRLWHGLDLGIEIRQIRQAR